MQTYVIARDANGKPLKRVAVARRGRLVYVAAPELLGAIGRGESSPVGFPDRDVFQLTDEAEALIAAGTPIDWTRLVRLPDELAPSHL